MSSLFTAAFSRAPSVGKVLFSVTVATNKEWMWIVWREGVFCHGRGSPAHCVSFPVGFTPCDLPVKGHCSVVASGVFWLSTTTQTTLCEQALILLFFCNSPTSGTKYTQDISFPLRHLRATQETSCVALEGGGGSVLASNAFRSADRQKQTNHLKYLKQTSRKSLLVESVLCFLSFSSSNKPHGLISECLRCEQVDLLTFGCGGISRADDRLTWGLPFELRCQKLKRNSVSLNRG